MFGFIPKTFVGDNVHDQVKLTQENGYDVSNIRVLALKSIVEDKKYVQDFHNHGRMKSSTNIIGYLVMVLRKPTGQIGESKNMLSKYKGSCIVTEILPLDRSEYKIFQKYKQLRHIIKELWQ